MFTNDRQIYYVEQVIAECDDSHDIPHYKDLRLLFIELDRRLSKL
jgi:hypothetical protein